MGGMKLQAEDFSLSLNFGVVTDDSFKFSPFIWTTGLNLDLHLNDYIMISPEVYGQFYEFKFDYFLIIPGAVLNLKLNKMFIGGGLVKPFLVGSGSSESGDIALKLNLGFRGNGLRLVFFAVTPFDNMFKKYYTSLGVTLGFEF
jgi:hypothetical protein